MVKCDPLINEDRNRRIILRDAIKTDFPFLSGTCPEQEVDQYRLQIEMETENKYGKTLGNIPISLDSVP